MKVRIFEIFTSVEGEGILYGTKTLFVRLAGCPFTCFYCDTKESLPLDSGIEYTIDDACQLIDSNLITVPGENFKIRTSVFLGYFEFRIFPNIGHFLRAKKKKIVGNVEKCCLGLFLQSGNNCKKHFLGSKFFSECNMGF